MPAAGSLEDLASRYARILVFGAGGGGDAAGAVHIYLKLKRLGADPILGGIVWERHAVDPHPGPITVEQLVNAEPLSRSAAIVTGETYAIRYGLEVKPQLARVAGALGVEALAVDSGKGARGVAEALKAASEALGVEAVVAVDVGGDGLALGCEEELWSPLADAVSIAGTLESGLPALYAVHSPGADGELPRETVLRYIAEIARMGGLVGVYGLTLEDMETLSRVMEVTVSEASRVPYDSFRGVVGERSIREGTRRVPLDPSMVATYLLGVEEVARHTRLPGLVAGSRSALQAREALNSACIYTELDLELDLARARERGLSPDLLELRSRGRESLRRRGCTPPPGC